MGGRIVGEVLIGLLETDRDAFLSAARNWSPALPSKSGKGNYRMVDLLAFAGVDPARRGQ